MVTILSVSRQSAGNQKLENNKLGRPRIKPIGHYNKKTLRYSFFYSAKLLPINTNGPLILPS